MFEPFDDQMDGNLLKENEIYNLFKETDKEAKVYSKILETQFYNAGKSF